MGFLEDLAEAEAQVAYLKRKVAGATCAEVGHAWKHIGGKNACCDLGRACGCSVPVYVCEKCGDCDYGENAEAEETKSACRAALESEHE